MVRIFNPINELKNLWRAPGNTFSLTLWWHFQLERLCRTKKKHETPTFFPGHVLVCWVGHLSPKCFSSSTQYYYIQWFNTYYTNCWWNWSQFCPRWMNLTDIVQYLLSDITISSLQQNWLTDVDMFHWNDSEGEEGFFFWCVYWFKLTYRLYLCFLEILGPCVVCQVD